MISHSRLNRESRPETFSTVVFAMANIFISYRREDSKAYAGRIFDRLEEHFGKDHVFMDVVDIAPGVDFLQAIDKALGSCEVCIAVIGKQWLNILDAKGRRRLGNPDDPVRLELAAALRMKTRIIPVLVDGADMPTAEGLPKDLKTLARQQAQELSDKRWSYDIGQLVKCLAGSSEEEDSYTELEERSSGSLQPRSYLATATMIFLIGALWGPGLGGLMHILMYIVTGEGIAVWEFKLTILGGLLFGLFMALIFAPFLRGGKISVRFTSRQKFVSRLSVVLSEFGYNPAIASGDFLTFKRWGGWKISAVIQGETATIVGPIMYVKKLQDRLGR